MLRVTGLIKRFQSEQRADLAAVDDVSFEVETGKLLTLLGPSGCGKTTTLRSIAGLEEPDDGEIQLGSRVVFSASKAVSVPSNRRRVGMVFQSYAIWPHMTVFQNVAYPLEGSGVSRTEVRERVAKVLGLVGLEEMMDRPAPFSPADNSSGSRWRARWSPNPSSSPGRAVVQSGRQAARTDAHRGARGPAPGRAHGGLRDP